MADDEQRPREVEQFRTEHRAERVFVLTAITPFRPAMDRFVLLEREAGASLLLVCVGCPFRAPLDRGEPYPVTDEMLAEFQRRMAGAEKAWEADAVPDGAYDGMTLVAERATVQSYDIVHMVAPRSNSPHARLMYAWTQVFPAVRKALR
ncbi:MAG TPA: hypothetical protein PKD09_21975 [Aggregatilinea sp.]|uniref:hypothetical protein n=1 Tax=Aggregatilinea sp. TaxID=2806333 RepID=UPI002CF36753|nr:hypothetical protein [Aggregatilinea sp.]HML24340.1 hypothetical protein [Aggregatilinea sp.]